MKSDRKQLSLFDAARDRLSKSPMIYDLWLTLRCLGVKGYIFVASTGRSGTQSLSRIFTAANNAVCVHEPPPVMLNRCPQGMDESAYFKELFHQKKKNAIRRAARSYRYYLETNHQFAKNFAGLAIDFFKNKTSVIHLKRDPAQVAASFFDIGSIPGKSYRGKLYLLDPLAEDNCVELAAMFRAEGPLDHDYYRCLWYWYEVEARISRLRAQYPQVPWFELQTDELNNEGRLTEMFETLAVEYDAAKLKELVCTRVNLKLHEKQRKSDDIDKAAMHRTFLEKMRQIRASASQREAKIATRV